MKGVYTVFSIGLADTSCWSRCEIAVSTGGWKVALVRPKVKSTWTLHLGLAGYKIVYSRYFCIICSFCVLRVRIKIIIVIIIANPDHLESSQYNNLYWCSGVDWDRLVMWGHRFLHEYYEGALWGTQCWPVPRNTGSCRESAQRCQNGQVFDSRHSAGRWVYSHSKGSEVITGFLQRPWSKQIDQSRRGSRIWRWWANVQITEAYFLFSFMSMFSTFDCWLFSICYLQLRTSCLQLAWHVWSLCTYLASSSAHMRYNGVTRGTHVRMNTRIIPV